GSDWPWRGTMPHVGLWPNTPQKCAGLRIDEPMSLPASGAVSPAASAAAEPPDDPPGARATSHGLVGVAEVELKLCQSARYRGTLVLPNSTAPAPISRSTTRALPAATFSRSDGSPHVVGRPATS